MAHVLAPGCAIRNGPGQSRHPESFHGAREFHELLILASPRKPIRIWMEVGDRDLLNPKVMRDGRDLLHALRYRLAQIARQANDE